MLVVIAIVAALATMVIGVAARIESREKEKRCKNTLALLTTALAQFHEYGFIYKDSDYIAFKFPLDCNDFLVADIENTLKNALGAGSVQISGAHDPDYSSNEVMYLLLSMVPASRQTLDKIDKKLITSGGATITIEGKEYPLLRVLDPWSETLRYDYYEDWGDYHADHPSKTWEDYINYIKDNRRTFPVIISAGPDKKFGTGDDITSR